MRATLASAFVVLAATLVGLTPSAAACTLISSPDFFEAEWAGKDTVAARLHEDLGLYDVVENTTRKIDPWYVSQFAMRTHTAQALASIGGGGLSADCRFGFRATDAIDLATGERVRILEKGAPVTANADTAVVFDPGCTNPLAYAWDVWDEPRVLRLPAAERPGLTPSKVQRAVLSPDGKWLGLFQNPTFTLVEPATGRLAFEDPVGHNSRAVFTRDGKLLALTAGTWEEPVLKIIDLDAPTPYVLTVRSDPVGEDQPRMTGVPAFGPVRSAAVAPALATASTGWLLPLGDRLRFFPDPRDLSSFRDSARMEGSNFYGAPLYRTETKEWYVPEGWDGPGGWPRALRVFDQDLVAGTRLQPPQTPTTVSLADPSSVAQGCPEELRVAVEPEPGPDATTHYRPVKLPAPGVAALIATIVVLVHMLGARRPR